MSPLQVARSWQAHGFLTKKKNTENEKLNPSRRWRLAESHHVVSSLAKRSNPNTKANQTQNSTNQTQSTEVFIKKKKKSPIHKPKPNPVTHRRSRRRRRRRSIVVVARPVAPHRRSKNADRSASAPVLGARRSMLLPAFPEGISLFFSLTLSQSLALYLTEIKTEMNRRSTS